LVRLIVDLIRVIRCLLWTPNSPPAAFSKPVDWKLELTVLHKAKSLVEAELNGFATSIAEDEELLGLKLPLRTRFAVLYRINVKEALSVHLQFLERLTALVLQLQEGVPFEELRSNYGESPLAPYIAEIV